MNAHHLGLNPDGSPQRTNDPITVKKFCPTHSYILRGSENLATVKNEHAEAIKRAYEEIYSASANDAEKSNVISEGRK